MKKYILIAGVNGAGKSTLYQSLQSLQSMPRVNTDEILRELGDWRNMTDVMPAGKIAVKRITGYFDEGITFNQETTLCGKSILNNITKAKERGHFIELHCYPRFFLSLKKDNNVTVRPTIQPAG